jgi:signal transduction histidine kinase
VAVGVDLPAVGAELYEITVTEELTSTLTALRWVLVIAAGLITLAGAALGRWAAGRVVAPLDGVAAAAASIARGSFGTRLSETRDPDLTTIVASFNSMVDAVEERMQRDARFAADVSHELRSPLTALITSVGVVQARRADLPPRAAAALELVERDLARFQRALEDLLDLGRLEAGPSALAVTTVDARELARQAMATSRPDAQDRLELPDRPVFVAADKSAVHRALVNLLENAQRHGGAVTRFTVAPVGDAVEFVVDDAGPGVALADRSRIFERFVRAGARGSLPGTGLGLALVAETARAHGGSAWCTTVPPDGTGSRFVLRLPTRAAVAASGRPDQVDGGVTGVEAT